MIKVMQIIIKCNFLKCHVILSPANNPQGAIFLIIGFNDWDPCATCWQCFFLSSNKAPLPHSSERGERSTLQSSLNPDSWYPLQFREKTSISRGSSGQQWCACEHICRVFMRNETLHICLRLTDVESNATCYLKISLEMALFLNFYHYCRDAGIYIKMTGEPICCLDTHCTRKWNFSDFLLP